MKWIKLLYFIIYQKNNNENYIINNNLKISNKMIKYIIDFHYNIIKYNNKINYYLSIILNKNIKIQYLFPCNIYNIYLLHK